MLAAVEALENNRLEEVKCQLKPVCKSQKSFTKASMEMVISWKHREDHAENQTQDLIVKVAE